MKTIIEFRFVVGATTQHTRTRQPTNQGHIDLALAVFPHGVTGGALDVLARMPLYQDGLDYRHGTGHGVGAFLNVHEGLCCYRSCFVVLSHEFTLN